MEELEIVQEIAGSALLVRLTSRDSPFQIFCLVGNPPPEKLAMFQAYYSRNPKSILERLEALSETDSGDKMARYYAGYGHKSIADCGAITLFFEGITMPTAKSLQDDPRYNGQEASTRYMDFSKTEAIDSHRLPLGREIQERWLAFYRACQQPLKAHLRQQFPIFENEDKKVYERAINARCFDITRCLLPAGMPTNASFTGSLRLVQDHLWRLTVHPDLDTRLVATAAIAGLSRLFPGTFAKQPRPEQLAWWQKSFLLDEKECQKRANTFKDATDPLQFEMEGVDRLQIPDEYAALLVERPLFTELTLDTNDFGYLKIRFLLDYGSFRDLQRHRAVTTPLPTLDVNLGFHPWYLEQLPPDLRVQAETLIAEQTAAIRTLSNDPFVRQPYVAMGFRVPVLVISSLHGLIYLIELRARTDVHPTLRAPVRRIGHHLNHALRGRVHIHVDTNEDDFSRRRGTATFIDRTTGKAIGET